MFSGNNMIEMIKSDIANIEKYHVSKVGLFGSFARDEQNDESDVDIIVEFEDRHETFDNYMDLKFYFENLFDRKVDLVIINSIKPSLRHSILRGVKYAKGA
jgi:uncharacterized protein